MRLACRIPQDPWLGKEQCAGGRPPPPRPAASCLSRLLQREGQGPGSFPANLGPQPDLPRAGPRNNGAVSALLGTVRPARPPQAQAEGLGGRPAVSHPPLARVPGPGAPELCLPSLCPGVLAGSSLPPEPPFPLWPPPFWTRGCLSNLVPGRDPACPWLSPAPSWAAPLSQPVSDPRKKPVRGPNLKLG